MKTTVLFDDEDASPTPNVDACIAGTWADWMLRLIGERAREEALAKLLRPTNVTR